MTFVFTQGNHPSTHNPPGYDIAYRDGHSGTLCPNTRSKASQVPNISLLLVVFSKQNTNEQEASPLHQAYTHNPIRSQQLANFFTPASTAQAFRGTVHALRSQAHADCKLSCSLCSKPMSTKVRTTQHHPDSISALPKRCLTSNACPSRLQQGPSFT